MIRRFKKEFKKELKYIFINTTIFYLIVLLTLFKNEDFIEYVNCDEPYKSILGLLIIYVILWGIIVSFMAVIKGLISNFYAASAIVFIFIILSIIFLSNTIMLTSGLLKQELELSEALKILTMISPFLILLISQLIKNNKEYQKLKDDKKLMISYLSKLDGRNVNGSVFFTLECINEVDENIRIENTPKNIYFINYSNELGVIERKSIKAYITHNEKKICSCESIVGGDIYLPKDGVLSIQLNQFRKINEGKLNIEFELSNSLNIKYRYIYTEINDEQRNNIEEIIEKD